MSTRPAEPFRTPGKGQTLPPAALHPRPRRTATPAISGNGGAKILAGERRQRGGPNHPGAFSQTRRQGAFVGWTGVEPVRLLILRRGAEL